MFSGVNQSDSDSRMASIIFGSSDGSGESRENQLLGESVQMEIGNINLDSDVNNSAEPAVQLKVKFENSSGTFASFEIPGNSTLDVQTNRNPNETITKPTNDFSSHRYMINGSRKFSNTDPEDPSVKVAQSQNQHQEDKKDVEIVHEIITLPDGSGKIHNKAGKQVKSPAPPPPAPVPVPVSVINTNPTLAALLNGGTPKRNLGQKILKSTARNGKSQQSQSLNFKFGSHSDINIKDFLADSSNYTLTPVVNTATADMLLNYDKSKYTAIPLDAFGSVSQPKKSFTILGYNILNAPPVMVGVGGSQTSYSTAPLSYSTNQTRFEEVTGSTNSNPSQFQFQPQYQYQQPSMSNSMGNSLRTIVLECSETMPQEAESDGSHTSEKSGSVNGNIYISKNGGSFQCNICHDRYYTKEYLDYHLIVVHNIRFVVQQQPAPMQISPAVLFSRVEENSLSAILPPGETLSRHFFCNMCSKSYTYLRNLKKHEITVHSAPVPERSQLNKTNGSSSLTATTPAFNIIKPPSTSSSSTLGTGLLGAHFAPVPVPTHSQSTSRNTVRNEMQKPILKPQQPKPKQVHPNPNPSLPAQCQVCHEILADRGALLIHTKQHVSSCSVCLKIFGSPRGLKLHSSVHFENRADKPYRCELSGCFKEYSHARSLKHHMKRHTSEGAVPTMEMEPEQQQQQQQEHEKITSLTLAAEGGCFNECQIQVKGENSKEKETNVDDLDESDSEYVSFCFGRIEEMKD